MVSCDYCKKRKVNTMMAFDCKCNYKLLCNLCRIPEQHNCTYDYKMEERKKLEKANPLVIAAKMEKV